MKTRHFVQTIRLLALKEQLLKADNDPNLRAAIVWYLLICPQYLLTTSCAPRHLEIIYWKK